MASVKDKLSQLGRPLVPILLKSRDGSQEIEVLYQCLTMLKERVLRNAMQGQFKDTIASFKEVKTEGEVSQYDKWQKEFEAVGLDKCAKFIVASDRTSLRAETIREMDCEPLADGATKEEEDAWVAKFTPIFERLVEENVAAMKENTLEELAKMCVDIQTDLQANKVAYDSYRLNLIQQSILEPDDANPGKHKLVFEKPEEVEALLSPATIDMLSDRIAEEVRAEKNLPLN